MATKLHFKPPFLSLLIITAIIISSTTLQVSTQEPTITVTGATGTTQTYTLTQLQAMPSVSMYGGFYQINQQIGNSGLWTGVSVLYLCNQVGGITPNNNIMVTGQGDSSFTYDMVNSGLNFNTAYKTYDNTTRNGRNQTEPITLILAYLVNGTTLPSNSLPAPRLVIVGPEGLMMDGSGGRSITQVNVVNTQPTPTPSPTPSPTPTSNPTPTSTPIPTATQTPTPSPTQTPTQQPTVVPTPTISPTPTPSEDTGSGIDMQIVIGILIVAIIIIIVVAVVLSRRHSGSA